MMWQASSQGASSGGSAANLGQMQSKITSDAFNNAPSMTSAIGVDVTAPGWNIQIDNYWATVK